MTKYNANYLLNNSAQVILMKCYTHQHYVFSLFSYLWCSLVQSITKPLAGKCYVQFTSKSVIVLLLLLWDTFSIVAWFSFSINTCDVWWVRNEVTWEELFGWSADLSLLSHSVSNVGFGSSPDCAVACCFLYSFRRALEVKSLEYIYWFGCGGRTENWFHFPRILGQQPFHNTCLATSY